MTGKIVIFSATAALAVALVAVRQDSSSDSRGKTTERPASSKLSAREGGSAHREVVSRWRPLTDDTLPTYDRVNVARQIHKDLSSEEVDYLFSTIDHQPLPGTQSQWWVVMNEIIEQMRKHGAAPDRYGAWLTSLVGDSSRHEVVRDYAAQQLCQWIAPAAPDISPGEADYNRKEAALEAITQVARDPSLVHTTIPGTALMALTDVSPRLPEELAAAAWKDLEPFLHEVLSGRHEAGLPLRTSAIQAVAIRREGAHLPVIQALARAENSDPTIRLSAIAALGFYGSTEDLDFLESLAASSNKYRYAAGAAVGRIVSK